ncbi:hypothetical protein [Pseudomonas graminis]|uniref:Uncharacterized protein n=1 Tax=Pseudomonas graminis TaxID=158627 RepID=A0A1I0JS78_9PSED|nr:hypothetical protein [Pseudomonas graminis]SEU13480.1 hypothetical protein SAMN05216197_1812 [Pseudomonas graminis]
MKFTTAYTPVTTAFASMTKKELSDFYECFILNVPYCLDELIQSIWQTPGFDSWRADFSPESLGALGEWFATKLKKTKSSSDAVQFSTVAQASPVAWDLTDEEKSLAVKVGMYYGEVAIRNHPSLSWMQLKGSKKLADYGQPVIGGPGIIPTNPVRVANAFAWGIADGSRTGSRLQETYDSWMEMINDK